MRPSLTLNPAKFTTNTDTKASNKGNKEAAASTTTPSTSFPGSSAEADISVMEEASDEDRTWKSESVFH